MSTNDTLWRMTLEVSDATGRTLSGKALPLERPVRVQDVRGGPFPGRPYFESHGRTSFDVSLRQHPNGFPVFTRHNYTEDPLGRVTYRRSDTEDALMFEAVLSRTYEADQKLVLVNDGVLNSVSIGFRPLQQVVRGKIVQRTESGMRELSLAPTGFGQYEDALVEAVRSELEDEGPQGTPVLDALQRHRARLRGRVSAARGHAHRKAPQPY